MARSRECQSGCSARCSTCCSAAAEKAALADPPFKADLLASAADIAWVYMKDDLVLSLSERSVFDRPTESGVRAYLSYWHMKDAIQLATRCKAVRKVVKTDIQRRIVLDGCAGLSGARRAPRSSRPTEGAGVPGEQRGQRNVRVGVLQQRVSYRLTDREQICVCDASDKRLSCWSPSGQARADIEISCGGISAR